MPVLIVGSLALLDDLSEEEGSRCKDEDEGPDFERGGLVAWARGAVREVGGKQHW